MGGATQAWFEAFHEEEAISLTNQFRIDLAFANSHARLHRTLEDYLKEGTLTSYDRKSFHVACVNLVRDLDGQRNPLRSLREAMGRWGPMNAFYRDVEKELSKDRLFIPKEDFRLLMTTGFSYYYALSFVRKINSAKRELPEFSVRSMIEAIDPRVFSRLLGDYLNEVRQEFVVGGSPRSFKKIGRILEVLGGGLLIGANVVSTGLGIGPAAASVGGGIVAIGDGLKG